MNTNENENQRIVMLLDCFKKAEAEAGLAAYAERGGDSGNVIVAPVTDLLLQKNTGEAVESILSGEWHGGTPRGDARRAALIAGADKRTAVILMTCFKKSIPKDADSAFAIVTQTGATWTVGEYLAHIRQEHNFMKTGNPADDPDMREI